MHSAWDLPDPHRVAIDVRDDDIDAYGHLWLDQAMRMPSEFAAALVAPPT